MGSRHSSPRDLEERHAAPLLDELASLYREVDGWFEGATCERSTDCCTFGVTGREPYPTSIERLALERAVRARGGLPKRRSLPLAEATDKPCALLGDTGQCLVYAARPFGCRTFYCGRASVPRSPSRDQLTRMSQAILELSRRLAPRDPGPRPMSRISGEWQEARRR